MISKSSVRFLIAAGVFNIVIWPRFAKAIVDDDRAWSGAHWSSSPTAFFWVHAVIITVAMCVGIGVLVVGVKAHRSLSRAASGPEASSPGSSTDKISSHH